MKTFQKLILFAVGLILLASNAQAGRWLTRDPMDIPAHMELDPHPFFDGNPYTFVGNNPVNNVDPYGLWIWFGWFRSQPSQPAQPSNPNSYGAMRAAMIGDPSDNNFNGKTGAQVATDIGMAVPKGILNTAAAMLGPGEAEGAYAAADEALQAARAAKAAKAASKCEKIADAISKGHAYGKHVLGEGQFDGATPGEFADIIQNVMENPSVTRALSNGRTAYYDANSGLVVIVNPNASDFGTAFVPANPLQYFNGLK